MPDRSVREAALWAMTRAQRPCLMEHNGGPCLLPAHHEGDHMAAFPRMTWAMVNLDALVSSTEVREALVAKVCNCSMSRYEGIKRHDHYCHSLAVAAVLDALGGTDTDYCWADDWLDKTQPDALGGTAGTEAEA